MVQPVTVAKNVFHAHGVDAQGREGPQPQASPRAGRGTRRALMCLVDQYCLLQRQILQLDRQVMAWHRSNEANKWLATIPGIGPLAASALVASVGDASNFKNGRSFAAFIGLVPKQSSSGGKERLDKISKRGDHYLRWLLVVGGLAMIRYAQRHGTRRPWLSARDEDRRRCSGQQDGSDRLGADDTRRRLPRTAATGSIGMSTPM
jgi:transposase